MASNYDFDNLKIDNINMDRAIKFASSKGIFSGLIISAAAGIGLFILHPILGIGAFVIGAALSVISEKRTLAKYFLEKYYPVLKGGSVSSYELSLMTKRDEIKIKEDLKKLIDWGILSISRDSIIRSQSVLIPITAEKDTATNMRANRPERIKRYEREYDQATRKIADALKGVQDPDMRLRVDNLREVLASITDNVYKNEDYLAYTDRLFSYYVPTLLTLIHSYAEIEASPAELETTADTKTSIQGAVVTLSLGFGEILKRIMNKREDDISSEIVVLEQILSTDGLRPDELAAMKNAVDPGTEAVEENLVDEGLNEIDKLINRRLKEIDQAPMQAVLQQANSGGTLEGGQ